MKKIMNKIFFLPAQWTRGSAAFNWYNFDFSDIFQKFYFFILYTFLSMCANLQGSLIFFLGKRNEIKSYYDLRITCF